MGSPEMNAITKPGRGRHGKRPDGSIKRHPNDVRARAVDRFMQLAMPASVAAELGLSYLTVWQWRKEWLDAKHAEGTKATPDQTAAESDLDRDGYSREQIGHMQDARLLARAAVSDADTGDEA